MPCPIVPRPITAIRPMSVTFPSSLNASLRSDCLIVAGFELVRKRLQDNRRGCAQCHLPSALSISRIEFCSGNTRHLAFGGTNGLFTIRRHRERAARADNPPSRHRSHRPQRRDCRVDRRVRIECTAVDGPTGDAGSIHWQRDPHWQLDCRRELRRVNATDTAQPRLFRRGRNDVGRRASTAA